LSERLGAKVSVVGAGVVGSSIAFSLAAEGLATELVLIDKDRRRAEGQAWDIDDAAAFIKPVHVRAADYPDSAGSRVVIFAAGASPNVDHGSIELARENVGILKESLPRVLRYCPEAVFIIVTSPVDVITYAASRIADIGDERIMGTGTVLCTSRFKRTLGRHVGVDPRNVHAYVVGANDQPVPLWSRVSVAGFHIDEYCRKQAIPPPDREKLFEPVRRGAEAVIRRKGVTQFSVSIAVGRIVEAVLRDEHSVLTVSGMVEGVYGLEGPNCFSLPAIVRAGGRRRPLPLALSPEELSWLQEASARLKDVHRELGL